MWDGRRLNVDVDGEVEDDGGGWSRGEEQRLKGGKEKKNTKSDGEEPKRSEQ